VCVCVYCHGRDRPVVCACVCVSEVQFSPCCIEFRHVLAMKILSVCPSVSLSVCSGIALSVVCLCVCVYCHDIALSLCFLRVYVYCYGRV